MLYCYQIDMNRQLHVLSSMAVFDLCFFHAKSNRNWFDYDTI